MDEKRLQEIKEVNRTRAGNIWSSSVIDELITALEASQSELAELAEADDAWWITCQKETDTLRAQLAEAQDVRNSWRDHSKRYKDYANEWSKLNADLRKQLNDQSILLGNCGTKLQKLQHDLEISQEAVEYWKYETPMFRPDEL